MINIKKMHPGRYLRLQRRKEMISYAKAEAKETGKTLVVIQLKETTLCSVYLEQNIASWKDKKWFQDSWVICAAIKGGSQQ